jgi:hypothetical protein
MAALVYNPSGTGVVQIHPSAEFADDLEGLAALMKESGVIPADAKVRIVDDMPRLENGDFVSQDRLIWNDNGPLGAMEK